MYLNNEKKLIFKLKSLRKNQNLIGIKSEFEAEGSSFEEVSNLRSITRMCNTKLFVKIGGVEAINDIYKCIEVGVDGIIAPMVESKFAAFKFISFFKKKKLLKFPHLSINIETKTAYENLDEIIQICKGTINNITIGRSDLSKSFFNKKVLPDSKLIQSIIVDVARKSSRYGITTTVGGSVSQNTIQEYAKSRLLKKHIKKLETRKVILPLNSFLRGNSIEKALEFEKFYILYKNEIVKFKSQSENERLSILTTRV
tara:strand:- start:212 stop:979 length:768 start_codon:yes stop_codon:yes gene_type:complete